MAESVFILGAGASKEAGGPLMGEFMKVAHDVWKKQVNDPGVKAFSEVFAARDKLEGLYSKSFIDLGNIEDLFGAVEMAGLIKKFPNYDVEKIDKLKGGLVQLIAKTLEYSIDFPMVKGGVNPPATYEIFVSLLKKFDKTNNIYDCSVITFNYDVCLDYAMGVNDIIPSYCLDLKKPTLGLPLLKLHGSLNWTDCVNCHTVIPIEPYRHVTSIKGRSDYWTFKDTGNFHMHLSRYLKDMASDYLKHNRISKCCEDMVISEYPVLVPPTWSKTSFPGSIVNVWGRVAKELGEAENIYVIGYSLPETDSFFRYLYSLGSISNIPIKRFWVFNPDEKVKLRFRDMIGRAIEKEFDFQKLTFSEAIDYVNDEL